MAKYRAIVNVMLKPSILDPQGRAVEATLRRLGHENLADVRIGKHIELTLSGERAEVERQLGEIASKVFANPVMETVVTRLEPLDE